ncbi:MAG: dienelactone hydrolase family protein [Dehalococcoidia bacterium]
MIAETVTIRGHGGDDVRAYMARPLGAGPFPGVVLLHHMPGWDEWSKEAVRKFAFNGYVAISPHLFHREAPDAAPDDAAAVARSAGGAPDDRIVGDAEGAAAHLRMLPYSNGKVGLIGFCSGGRQTYLVNCRSTAFDAAVDCWGGRVVAADDQLTERQPVAPLSLTGEMHAPLLGIFGNDDRSPTPEDVDVTEAELKKHNKVYEFHRYDGAGHGFFAVNRPGYRPEQATDAWEKVFAWYGKYLATDS